MECQCLRPSRRFARSMFTFSLSFVERGERGLLNFIVSEEKNIQWRFAQTVVTLPRQLHYSNNFLKNNYNKDMRCTANGETNISRRRRYSAILCSYSDSPDTSATTSNESAAGVMQHGLWNKSQELML